MHHLFVSQQEEHVSPSPEASGQLFSALPQTPAAYPPVPETSNCGHGWFLYVHPLSPLAAPESYVHRLCTPFDGVLSA